MTHPVEIELHVGHYGDGTGAGGIVDEVKYARKFIKRIYDILITNKVPATYYEDKTSKNQTQNINNLIKHHNADRDGLIVSGHLNASGSLTDRPIGVEVLYSTQKDLAANVAKAVSDASGLINRGAKYRDNIGVLTRTYEPSILIEFGFVNSKKDVELMDKNFEGICQAVAKVLAAAIGYSIKHSATNEENSDLNKRAQALIKKAVADKVFNSDHKDVGKYTQEQLLKYVVTYAERLTK